jgi:hypothetical protein
MVKRPALVALAPAPPGAQGPKEGIELFGADGYAVGMRLGDGCDPGSETVPAT